MTGSTDEIAAYLIAFEDKDKKWNLSEYKPKRSRNSNSYFHVLCDALRQVLGISMARCKNHLIADYGQIEYIDDEPVIYKTNAPEEVMMEQEYPHTKCIKVAKEKGHNVYFYRVYRPSHTYNSAEMARLIDGTIQECQQQNIPTATPEELAHMAQLWEQVYEQKNKRMRDKTGSQKKS